VLLTLHPGRTLERAQIAGIVHLVSSSVPELSPKAVSVLDGSGALLSGADDSGRGLDAQQLQYVQQIESGYLKRVVEILEPVVGRDNLRATVTADIDFTQSESTSEEFKPNQGDAPAAVKLVQRNESSAPGAAQPSGVPGAASNQPPGPATAPLTGSAAPLQPAQGGYAGGNLRRDAVTQYEVDKTVRVTRNATGALKRLSAAVVVNHRASTDAKGKTTSAPLAADELEKITALVQQSLGFDQARGDSVKVVNAPFRVEPLPKVEPLPIYQQPWLLDLLRAAAAPLALAAVALVVVLKLIRPALNAALEPAPTPEAGGRLDVVADNDVAAALPVAGSPPALGAPAADQRLENARSYAQQNPAAVAAIVKNWVGGDAAGAAPGAAKTAKAG
jgi:flagellar M-ring protein FliF